jgi:xylan 1,4-beta-xylosidase
VLARIYALATSEHINFLGAVTWAFEFENQPPFEGFRELATNGIDKPVLNAFRMFGLLGTERVKATSSGSLPTEDVLRDGVRGTPDVNVIGTRSNHEISVLIWNYHDDDLDSPSAQIDLRIDGLQVATTHARLEHFRIDSTHSNAFAAWKTMGSPQSLSGAQLNELEREAQLQLLSSPEEIPIEKGVTELHFELPRQSLSLLRLRW